MAVPDVLAGSMCAPSARRRTPRPAHHLTMPDVEDELDDDQTAAERSPAPAALPVCYFPCPFFHV